MKKLCHLNQERNRHRSSENVIWIRREICTDSPKQVDFDVRRQQVMDFYCRKHNYELWTGILTRSNGLKLKLKSRSKKMLLFHHNFNSRTTRIMLMFCACNHQIPLFCKKPHTVMATIICVHIHLPEWRESELWISELGERTPSNYCMAPNTFTPPPWGWVTAALSMIHSTGREHTGLFNTV